MVVKSFSPIPSQIATVYLSSKRTCHQRSIKFHPLSSEKNQNQDKSITELQKEIQLQSLSRITIPSILFSFLCYSIFPSITLGIQTWAHDMYDGSNTGKGYETLNLILTDNSNQFLQNVHNFLALTFAFLTGSTLQFMLRQQDILYKALFDEVTALVSLLEQSALISEGRSDLYRNLLQSLTSYLENDLKLVTNYVSVQEEQENGNTSTHALTSSSSLSYVINEMGISRENLPSYILSRRPENDPLERILYITSVGEPSSIYSSVLELRRARSKRLGALQRKMPEINMYLLYVLGSTVFVSFPFVTAGSETVGGDGLLQLYRAQLSIVVFAMCVVLGMINELKQPEIASVYSVNYDFLGKMMNGLECELDERMKSCDAAVEFQINSSSDTIMMPHKDLDSSSRTKSIVRRIIRNLRSFEFHKSTRKS